MSSELVEASPKMPIHALNGYPSLSPPAGG